MTDLDARLAQLQPGQERKRPERLIVGHEHFCSACYGIGNGVKQGSARGWWRCTDRPCVQRNEALCRVHRERLANQEPQP